MHLLLFVWSLLSSTHRPSIVHPHVVIQTPLYTPNLLEVVDQVPSLQQQPFRNMICFSSDPSTIIKTDGITQVPLTDVFRSKSPFFATNRSYPRSNYLLFSRSKYASVMDYADFCCMEDKLADIVLAYLGDEKKTWMVWMDDPLLMATVRRLGSKHVVMDQTTWITCNKEGFQDFILWGDRQGTFQ